MIEGDDPYGAEAFCGAIGYVKFGKNYNRSTRCRVEMSLFWEITGSLAAASNNLRVGNQLLFSKSKIIIKQTIFNRVHTKDPRPTSSIQR